MCEGGAPPEMEGHKVMREEVFGSDARWVRRTSSKYGKSLRKAVPRDVAAAWQPPVARANPTDLIFSQDQVRVAELVPLRHERMSISPFAFYRGAALVMAHDLSALPTTGIEVQVCGDAHLANFGFYLSPERRCVFDINDFDETTRGPWEWDVARLAASVEVLGRERGLRPNQLEGCVLAATRSYREAMRRFASMGHLDVWYAHFDICDLLPQVSDAFAKGKRKKAWKEIARANGKDAARATTRLTEVRDGKLSFVSSPPEIVPLAELADMREDGQEFVDEVEHLVSQVLSRYLQTLPPERVRLLERYHAIDIARKTAGVDSIGMRCWIIALEGADERDPLVLQVREATESVLQRFVGKGAYNNNGQRVAEGQHALQAASDVFLGWTSVVGADGRTHDYYVRQLWDGKGALDLMNIEPAMLEHVCGLCGATLAHAHARTGDRFAIASYLGASDIFDQAMLVFSRTYADQNERDYLDFLERIWH